MMYPLPPGSNIGILGGGQLARMLSLAAANLGLNCHIYAPEKDSPAFQVAAARTISVYDDETALAKFADAVDAITYEFENVPASTVEFLEKLKPVRPGSKALSVAQDRLAEKSLARELGAMTAAFAPVTTMADLESAITATGLPAILKTTRMGYDGKGQARINTPADMGPALAMMKGQPAILESFVHFKSEFSVICARTAIGEFAAYDIAENVHRNHILHTSTVPAKIDAELAEEAIYVARRLAETLDYVGVMGVEFFLGDDVIYVNEIAPRVHNSGHWTMDGCLVSQFEQHIRAVAGWPLGSTIRHSNVVMTNLLGDDVNQWAALASEAGTATHLYGKTESRPGRKMGHINRITPRQG